MSIDIQQLLAFKDELHKVGSVGSFLGGFGGRALIGGAAGGLIGAKTGDPDAPKGKRIVRGALLGAAAGAGSRLLTGAGRQEAKAGLSNFGKRQWYGVTGHGAKDLASAEKIGLISKGATPIERESFQKGYDNIPGTLKGLMHNPKDVLKNTWKKQNTLGKAFVGLGAVDAAHQATTPTEAGGPGKAERILRSAGGSAGYLLGPAGLLSGAVAGTATGSIAGRIGRGIDHFIPGQHKPAPLPAQENT